MHTTPCGTTTIRLSRPLHERVLERFSDVLRGWQAAWRQHAERRRAHLQLEAVAEMDELMLRDIGASESMIAAAAARRDAHLMRMFELQFGTDVDRLRGLM